MIPLCDTSLDDTSLMISLSIISLSLRYISHWYLSPYDISLYDTHLYHLNHKTSRHRTTGTTPSPTSNPSLPHYLRVAAWARCGFPLQVASTLTEAARGATEPEGGARLARGIADRTAVHVCVASDGGGIDTRFLHDHLSDAYSDGGDCSGGCRKLTAMAADYWPTGWTHTHTACTNAQQQRCTAELQSVEVDCRLRKPCLLICPSRLIHRLSPRGLIPCKNT